MNRLTLVFLASLTLVACGGGGGGGGGTSSGSGSSSNNNNDSGNQSGDEQDEVSVPSQNIYLPLVNDLGWIYDVVDTEFASTIIAETYNTEDETFALSTEFPDAGDDVALDQILSSTPERVSLHRFEAQNFTVPLDATLEGVVVDVAITLDNLVLSEAISFIADTPDSDVVNATMQIDVDGTIGGAPITRENDAVSMTVTPIITNSEEKNIETPWGLLRGKDVEATLRLNGTYNPFLIFPVDINLVIVEAASYAIGVGPVSRTISFYWDTDNSAENGNGSLLYIVDLDVSGLKGLPEPIIYTLNGLMAEAPDSISIGIRSELNQLEPVSTIGYGLLNQDDINNLEWANVELTNDRSEYIVEITAPTVVPSISLSEVVYISDDLGETQLPVNISLSIED